MTVDTATLRARYRETVAATAHGGSGEDFATLAAYLPALCDALDEMRTERDSWQADVERLHRDLAHQMDRIAEEMAAVDEERERVRVLNRIGARIVESEVSRRPGLRSLAIEELRAALATAGGEGQERVRTRRETLEVAIRALGYAVPFTYGDEKQATRLTASVHADYLHAHGVDLPLAEIRDACGLPSAAEGGATP